MNPKPGPPSSRRAKRERPARDMDVTPFAAILEELVGRIPGAVAAVLVDLEGETVDYAGQVDPFNAKVAAAHWQIVLSQLDPLAVFRPRQLIVRSAKKSYIVRRLPEGYALVVELSRRAGFTPSTRALEACEAALAREAAWRKEGPSAWVGVEVLMDGRRRPREVHLRSNRHALEVLGALVGLPRRERGFRVRLATGAELNLVREPGGHWYVDES
jgi:hypothetical protein